MQIMLNHFGRSADGLSLDRILVALNFTSQIFFLVYMLNTEFLLLIEIDCNIDRLQRLQAKYGNCENLMATNTRFFFFLSTVKLKK